MALTNYEKGARFERKVLAHLVGDQKKENPTVGLLHELVSDYGVETGYVQRNLWMPHVSIWGRRTPGSKSKIDLPILVTITDNDFAILTQVALGVQCKTERYHSKAAIQAMLRDIELTTGFYAFWAYSGARGRITIEPDIKTTLFSILRNRGLTFPTVTGIVHTA